MPHAVHALLQYKNITVEPLCLETMCTTQPGVAAQACLCPLIATASCHSQQGS